MDKLKTITKWLADYLKDNGKTTFVINYRHDRRNSLLTYICSEACKNTSTNVLVCCSPLVVDSLKNIYSGNIDSGYLPSYSDMVYKADSFNGVIVGAIEKTFGKYYRSYNKGYEYLSDIFPLYDIPYSDIIKETDDVFGTDVSYSDIREEFEKYQIVEWANSMEDKYGILTSKENPTRHDQWKYFTQDQKTIIAFMHARQHKTLHKIINKPYPKLEG